MLEWAGQMSQRGPDRRDTGRPAIQWHRARTALEDAGQGTGAALQVEADVQVQHVRERVVCHPPPRRLCVWLCIRSHSRSGKSRCTTVAGDQTMGRDLNSVGDQAGSPVCTTLWGTITLSAP